jgi:hypothetical protein
MEPLIYKEYSAAWTEYLIFLLFFSLWNIIKRQLNYFLFKLTPTWYVNILFVWSGAD